MTLREKFQLLTEEQTAILATVKDAEGLDAFLAEVDGTLTNDEKAKALMYLQSDAPLTFEAMEAAAGSELKHSSATALSDDDLEAAAGGYGKDTRLGWWYDCKNCGQANDKPLHTCNSTCKKCGVMCRNTIPWSDGSKHERCKYCGMWCMHCSCDPKK